MLSVTKTLNCHIPAGKLTKLASLCPPCKGNSSDLYNLDMLVLMGYSNSQISN